LKYQIRTFAIYLHKSTAPVFFKKAGAVSSDTMKNICITLLFVLFVSTVFGQINREYFAQKLDSIKSKFPNVDVKIPAAELPFYTALSYFPELSKVDITVRFGHTKTSMLCRPTESSFFSVGRRYIIVIKRDTSDPIYPLHASFEAIIGWFGHELAHIIRYERQRKMTILADGFRFLTRTKFRSQYEKETDKIVIEKGLGAELYEASRYIFDNPKIPERYMAFKRKIYHTLDDIRTLNNIHIQH
jgi:hypothetical protein